MVQKNAENAHSSKNSAEQGATTADNGRQAVQDMIASINEITRSNAAIRDAVENSNKEMSEITKVIAAIESKTKVINDIVFQTKLLSFNASVEAARAGEHGKGFAVVAEEVGNLAQMSGASALEISTMLESSVQAVEKIILNTRSRVEGLLFHGQSKIDAGAATAATCSENLEAIVVNVNLVREMVEEISSASQEQATGIQEINRSMNELDGVTHRNLASAKETASASGRLSQQADELRRVIGRLTSEVHGSSAEKTSAQTTVRDPVHERSESIQAQSAIVLKIRPKAA